MSTLSMQSPAKVNLFLEIIRRRQDGYHDLESVFQTIPLYDTISVCTTEDITMECSNPLIPTDDRNLIIQAAKLLREITAIKDGAHFNLEKRIPFAGGLGGGSSNAATVLLLLNRLWKLNLSQSDLCDIAGRIGSDVPFFIYGGVCLCQGRGEIVTPLKGINPLPLKIIAPPWGISTPEAYSSLDPAHFARVKIDSFIDCLSNTPQDTAEIYAKSYNHFERPVFKLEPRQHNLQNILRDNHIMARMSGSGSSVWLLDSENVQVKALLPNNIEIIL